MNRAHTDAPRSGYAAYTNTNAPEWHWLVVWDLLLNNLATGLFMAAAVAELARPELFASVVVWAYPVALVLLLADLVCLVLDLGDPLRFHHMLRVLKLSSPMSFGTWSLTAFSLPLTVIVALRALLLIGLVEPDSVWIRSIHGCAALVGSGPAFASAAYKGVLFSTNAQPGWRDARSFGAYLMNSAIMLGCGELLAIAVISGDYPAVATIRQALVILILLNAVPLVLVTRELYPTLRRVYTSSQSIIGVSSIAFLGMLLPITLLRASDLAFSSILAIGLLLGTSLAIRAVIVFLPHRV